MTFYCTFEKVNFRRCEPPNNNKEELIMKRSFGIHLFITTVLGGAVGSWMILAITTQSISYGELAMLAIIATVLNIICGDDKKSNSKQDEK